MADEELTLEEKKQLIINTIQTIDNISEGIQEGYPYTDTGEQWEVKDYKSLLFRKLGIIEYKIITEDTTSTAENKTAEEMQT